MTTDNLFTCPCCGYRTLTSPPGSYDICRVCSWEDDPVQLLDPWYIGGANHRPLAESQKNFISFGACNNRSRKTAKGPQPGDRRDPQWRAAEEKDRSCVRVPRDLTPEEYKNPQFWYYWRVGG